MNIYLKLIALVSMIIFSIASQASCVILLHGLARSPQSMAVLEQHLQQANFVTVNLGYPSREHPIEELAELAITPALEKCPKHMAVNFVTHSLGGILVRQYLTQQRIPQLKHVVMLGPPNKGSEVVDKLGKVPGFHFLNGDAGLALGTDKRSIPNQLGPADFDVGIIAGTQSINFILSMLIPGKDDGKVSITNTHLEGMNDHIQMPVTHPFMMKNKQVITQVIHYLRQGSFTRHDLKSSPSP